MAVTVTVHWQDGETERVDSVVVSASAREALDVKPVFTDVADVEMLKAIAAALYTKCDADPYASSPIYEFGRARERTEEAAMWAVKGATKGT